MARCTIDWYRGWVRHSAEGCGRCADLLRAYNRQAKRDQRIRKRGAPAKPRAHSPEFKKAVVEAARRRGARAAATEHGLAVRLVYSWATQAGVTPKPPTRT